MERWLPVVGYEQWYEVSDHGRVRSVERTVALIHNWKPSSRRYRERILSQNIGGGGGHVIVVLSREGNYQRRLVHHLVLEAFVCPRPPGEIGLHWDDDPLNNHLSNLRWGTHSDNQDDKVRNGNHHNTQKTHCPQGHEYTEDNIRWYEKKNGRRARRCLTCVREQKIQSYHRNKK